MPTWTSFAAFDRELDKLKRELDLAEKRKITHDMAERAQKLANRAARSDLGGDLKFRNWPPKAETEIKMTAKGAAILHPTKTGAGVWTVLEFGRYHEGGVGGFMGPGVSFRTGKTSARTKAEGGGRKVRARKAKRWTGYTQGKGTASDAVAAMERELPKVAEDGVRRVIRKHFDVT